MPRGQETPAWQGNLLVMLLLVRQRPALAIGDATGNADNLRPPCEPRSAETVRQRRNATTA